MTEYNVQVTISGDAKDAEEAIESIGRRLKKMGMPLKNFKTGMEGQNRVLDKTRRAFEKLKRPMQVMGRALGGMKQRVFNLKTALIGLAGAGGLGLLARGFLNTARQMELAQFRLTAVMQGNVKAGKEALEWIREWVMKLPLSTSDAVETFTYLRVLGIEAGKGIMQSIGNAAYATGNAMRDIAVSLISLYSLTLRRAGIEMERQGDVAILTSGKVRKVVNDDTASIRKGVLEIFDEKYNNALEAAKYTFAGAWETLTSQYAEFQQMTMEGGPFAFIIDKMNELSALIDEKYKSGALQKWADETAIATMTAVSAALTGLTGMVTVVGGIVNLFQEYPTMGKVGIVGWMLFGRWGALAAGAVGGILDEIKKQTGGFQDWASNVAESYLAGAGATYKGGEVPTPLPAKPKKPLPSAGEKGDPFLPLITTLTRVKAELDKVIKGAKDLGPVGKRSGKEVQDGAIGAAAGVGELEEKIKAAEAAAEKRTDKTLRLTNALYQLEEEGLVITEHILAEWDAMNNDQRENYLYMLTDLVKESKSAADTLVDIYQEMSTTITRSFSKMFEDLFKGKLGWEEWLRSLYGSLAKMMGEEASKSLGALVFGKGQFSATLFGKIFGKKGTPAATEGPGTETYAQLGEVIGEKSGETQAKTLAEIWQSGTMAKGAMIGGFAMMAGGAYQTARAQGGGVGQAAATQGIGLGLGAAGAAGAMGATAGGAMVAGGVGLLVGAAMGGIGAAQAKKHKHDAQRAAAKEWRAQIGGMGEMGYYVDPTMGGANWALYQRKKAEWDKYLQRLQQIQQSLEGAVTNAFAAGMEGATETAGFEVFRETFAKTIKDTVLQSITAAIAESGVVTRWFAGFAQIPMTQVSNVLGEVNKFFSQIQDSITKTILVPLKEGIAEAVTDAFKFVASKGDAGKVLAVALFSIFAVSLIKPIRNLLITVFVGTAKLWQKILEPVFRFMWQINQEIKRALGLLDDWQEDMERAGFAFTADMDKRLVEMYKNAYQTLSRALSSALKKGFNAPSVNAGMRVLERSLKEGIYKWVVDGLSKALAASGLFLTVIARNARLLVQFFFKAMRGEFDYTLFEGILKGITNTVNEAMPGLLGVFERFYAIVEPWRKAFFKSGGSRIDYYIDVELDEEPDLPAWQQNIQDWMDEHPVVASLLKLDFEKAAEEFKLKFERDYPVITEISRFNFFKAWQELLIQLEQEHPVVVHIGRFEFLKAFQDMIIELQNKWPSKMFWWNWIPTAGLRGDFEGMDVPDPTGRPGPNNPGAGGIIINLNVGSVGSDYDVDRMMRRIEENVELLR
jgi:hypothetical protein